MNLLSVMFGLFLIGSSKKFGSEYLKDEEFVTLVASIASIIGIFRFLFAIGLDNFSYKKVYSFIIILQIIFAFTLPSDLSQIRGFSKSYFLVAVSASQLLEGAHFVLMPTVLAKMFGTEGGMRVFSVGFGFVGVASLVNILFLDLFLEPESQLYIGFNGLCYIYGSFSIISLLILLTVFKEEKVSFLGDSK